MPSSASGAVWPEMANLLPPRESGTCSSGVIGCMAERLRETAGRRGEPAGVDIVAGPDAYRDLPRLVREAEAGGKGVNVLLSPRGNLRRNRPRAARPQRREQPYVAIMRGCNNYLFLLRGALHAGPSSGAAIRRLFVARGAQLVRKRLPRGDAAGAERQFLPYGRRRFPGADAPRGRRSRRCCACGSPPRIPRT